MKKRYNLKLRQLRNPFEKTIYQSHILSLGMYINILLQYQEHLSKLETEIDALAKEIEEYNIIQSIPGIGEKIAATIISEIGEIDRFNNPKKLVAFAGVDPSVFESGKVYSHHKSNYQNEDLVGFDMPYIWLFVVVFVIVVRRKRLMKSSLAIKE